MSFYRFPAMKGLNEFTDQDQLACIQDETKEAIEACGNWGLAQLDGKPLEPQKRAYGIELMDVIHAAETALRMEFDEEECEALRELTIEKNRKRGYYEEEIDD